MCQPRSDAARREWRFRTANRQARPVSGAGYRIGTGQRAPFDDRTTGIGGGVSVMLGDIVGEVYRTAALL
jgi:hypothetical protein